MNHTSKVTKLLTRVMFVFLVAFVLAQKAQAETFVVDRLTDQGEGEEFMGDLRYCITNARSGEDVIVFAVTGTINLTSALPDLNVSVSIEGPGADLLTVRRDTGGDYRIFTVSSGTTVQISGLTMANGRVFDPGGGAVFGGGIFNAGTLTVTNSTLSGNGASTSCPGSACSEPAGGAFFNAGTLTLNNSVLSGNFAIACGFVYCNGAGGGIDNQGTLTVSYSTLSGNRAAGGGGIRNRGMLAISNSTFSRNDAEYAGGGISNDGTLTVSNSTISGNFAGVKGCLDRCTGAFGGGIYNGGTLTVINSTISGNDAVDLSGVGGGGGIFNSETLTISNSTVSRNNADRGGGIFNSRTLHMRNTILAGNTAIFGAQSGPDLRGALTSSGYNLIGNTEGGAGFDYKTDLLDVDPLLGPLEDNGGPTLTHALLPGSPAIDAGDPDFQGPPDFDQRGEGFARIVKGRLDIGAFEVQAEIGLGAAIRKVMADMANLRDAVF